jgi:hypothetical protein
MNGRFDARVDARVGRAVRAGGVAARRRGAGRGVHRRRRRSTARVSTTCALRRRRWRRPPTSRSTRRAPRAEGTADGARARRRRLGKAEQGRASRPRLSRLDVGHRTVGRRGRDRLLGIVTVAQDVNTRGELAAAQRRAATQTQVELAESQRSVRRREPHADRSAGARCAALRGRRRARSSCAATTSTSRSRSSPALPKGHVYQAWTAAKGSATMQPSVTFTPNADGVAVVALPVDATRVGTVAVSVEPEGGSKAPDHDADLRSSAELKENRTHTARARHPRHAPRRDPLRGAPPVRQRLPPVGARGRPRPRRARRDRAQPRRGAADVITGWRISAPSSSSRPTTTARSMRSRPRLRKHRGPRSFVGPKDAVDALWQRVRDWHPRRRSCAQCSRSTRSCRMRIALRRGDDVPVRRARDEDAAVVADHSARMILGELGYDPRANRSGLHRRGAPARSRSGCGGSGSSTAACASSSTSGRAPPRPRSCKASGRPPEQRRQRVRDASRPWPASRVACSLRRPASRCTSTTSTRRRSRCTNGSGFHASARFRRCCSRERA